MSFLCTHRKDETVQPSTSTSITSCTVQFSSFRNEDSIFLRTFTCDVGSDESSNVRVLLDSGAQRNYISNNLAVKHNLQIVDENISLTINGFNSSRHTMTSLVEVPLRTGSKEHVINAVIVPSIDIQFVIDNLQEIVGGFISRGFKLADEMLCQSSGVVGDIGLVLGTVSEYVFPVDQVFFGNGSINKSCYLNSPNGVVFSGESHVMLENMNNLAPNDHNSKSVDVSSTEKGIVQSCAISEVNTAACSISIVDNIDAAEDLELDQVVSEASKQQCDAVLNIDNSSVLSITVPSLSNEIIDENSHDQISDVPETIACAATVSNHDSSVDVTHCLPLDRFSSLGRLLSTMKYVFKFISNTKNSSLFSSKHYTCSHLTENTLSCV